MIGHIIGFLGSQPRDLGVVKIQFEGGHCFPSTPEGMKLFRDAEEEGYVQVHCKPVWSKRFHFKNIRGAKE